MKKDSIKRVISVLILFTMVFLFACSQEDDIDSEFGKEMAATAEPHQGVQDEAKRISGESNPLPDIEVEKKIKWLTWHPMDETSATAELFKAKYGVPDKENGDNIISLLTVKYDDRYERLGMLIQSGDSPDMFQFEERNYPYSVYNKLCEPVDEIFDFDKPEWDATRDTMKLFNWGGRNYTAITVLNNSTSLLFYRKSVVEGAGLKDPYELWQKDEWDWNTFMDMCKGFTDVEEGKYSVMGYYIDESAILTTGVGILSLENGLLKNNLDDLRIERAMDLLSQLSANDYRYPYHELNNWNLNKGLFRSGNLLFWNDGPWVYQEDLTEYRRRDDWADDEVCVVPFPKDPNSDIYYQRGKQDAMMLAAGAQNKEGFEAWVMCELVAANDEGMKEQSRDKLKVDYHWTDAQLDALDKILELPVVFDFKNGIGEDLADATNSRSPIESLTKPVIVEGESFIQHREAYRGVIEKRIADMNSDSGPPNIKGGGVPVQLILAIVIGLAVLVVIGIVVFKKIRGY